jgi:hypothetical protein
MPTIPTSLRTHQDKCLSELSPSLQKEIAEYAEATASSFATQRIVTFRSGIKLTRNQIHYMLSKHQKSQSDVDAFSDSSADQLISYSRVEGTFCLCVS